MLSSTRARVFTAGLAVAAVIGTAVIVWVATQGSGDPEPWPPFSMTYKVLASEQPDRATEYQVWELEYTSSRDWAQTLVRDDVDARRVGSVDRFDGTTLTRFNALADTTNHFPREGGALPVPNRWLVPKQIEDYEDRGFTVKSTAPDGTATLELLDVMVCTPAEPRSIDVCPQSGAIDTRTKLSVNQDGIPFEVIESFASNSYVAFLVEYFEVRP